MSFGLSYRNGSFEISPSGKLTQVSGSVKFSKDIQKFLLTTNNGGLYGTKVPFLIGQKLQISAVDLNLKQYLKQAIYNYTLLQKGNQFLDSSEQLTNASLSTWVNPDDPNEIDWQAEFVLASGVIVDDIPTQSIKAGI